MSLFSNEPITMVHQSTQSIVVGPFFKKGSSPLVEIGSPPNENGA